MTTTCPKCQSTETRYREKRADWFCDGCDHSWAAPAPALDKVGRAAQPLQIFLSYGHDQHTPDAIRIKTDLEARGHTVWFDDERLRVGRDWESFIEQGLRACDLVVLLMTPHAVRRRKSNDPDSRDGYCLNELAKAIEKNKTIIPVLLVTLEDGPPTSICRIQYLDLTDAVPTAEREERYRVRFDRLVRAIEEKELDFGGGQARLQRLLRPLDFTRQMERHIASFTGRLWLLADIDAWLALPTGARVLWLTGGPGIGKSAIATHLCHRRGEVIAHHFCVHGDDDKASPTRAILSVAFQMASHLPEYYRRLQVLDLEEEVAKNPATLFDRIVVQPLSKDFPVPAGGPRLVIIDALDEATRVDVGGRSQNAIAQIVHEQWHHVPAWLRLFITSRPESVLLEELQHLDPLVLDAQRPENLADIRAFLVTELPRRNVHHDDPTIAAIMERCEGIFLYATELLNEIDAGRETLSRLDELPQGMKGHYRRFFRRQMPDLTVYLQKIRPMLECICAAREPLPLGVLGQATGAERVDLLAQIALVGSLFPIRVGPEASGDSDTAAPFHKSVRDWLVDIDSKTRLAQAGNYAVDLAKGQKRLAEACMRAFRLGPEHMRAYELRHATEHLVAAGRAADAAEMMTDFGYHHARLEKLGAGEVAEVTKDFAAMAQAELPAEQRERVETWQRFHDENAHLLRRQGTQPEVQLMQHAYAHADTSPVTHGAETWLAQYPAKQWWFRKLHRPKHSVRDACLRTLEVQPESVNSVALHADGRRVVTGSSDSMVRVWDLDTGVCLRTLEGHTKWVTSVALHADGRRAVTGSWDKTVRVWDLDTGACLRTLEGHNDWVKSVALHADGRRAVTVSNDETVRVWDLDTGACLRTLEGHTSFVNSVALHADGRRAVTGSWDKTVRVWDLDTGACLRTLEGHTRAVNSVALHADGRRAVTGSDDETVRVWDLDTGACLRTLEGHSSGVNSVALHADGRRAVTGSDDETVRVWDLDTGACLRTLEGHSSGVNSVALHADGQRAVTGSGYNVRVWHLDMGACLRKVDGHTDRVSSVALHADGRRAVTGSKDMTVRVWDLDTGGCLRTLEGHTGGVWPVVLHADRRRAVTGSKDMTVRVWDLDTGACLRTLEGHTGGVGSVVLHADGRRAVVGSEDMTMRVWDLDTGACLRTLEGHTEQIWSVVLHADGRRAVTGSKDMTMRVWDLDTGVCLRTLEGHTGGVGSVVLHADGRRAVTGSGDNTVRVWDLDTGACLRTLEGHGRQVYSVALHADGRRVVTGSWDKTVRVWDLDTGACLKTLEGHTSHVTSVALHADGRRAETVSRDNTVRVWDLDTGACLGVWTGGDIVLLDLDTRRDCGRARIVAGCDDGSVLFLELLPPGPLTRTTLATWSPTHPLVATVLDTGAVTLHQWHPASAHLEEIARLAPSSAAITSLCFSLDGTRLQLLFPVAPERILDAITLQPAAPPTCAWGPPRTTSPDNAWRADIEDGQLKIVAASK